MYYIEIKGFNQNIEKNLLRIYMVQHRIEKQKEFFSSEGINVNNTQDLEYLNERIAVLSELFEIEIVLDVQFHLPEKMHEAMILAKTSIN